MSGRYPSEVVRVVVTILAPFIAVFGLYVVAHGHYGPGGGFAGGVVLAVAAMLPRLTLDDALVYRGLPYEVGPITGAVGLLLFAVLGLVPVLLGAPFLDYAAVEIGEIAASRVRYLGILVIEIAVGAAVFGAMLMIYDVIAGRAR